MEKNDWCDYAEQCEFAQYCQWGKACMLHKIKRVSINK